MSSCAQMARTGWQLCRLPEASPGGSWLCHNNSNTIAVSGLGHMVCWLVGVPFTVVF